LIRLHYTTFFPTPKGALTDLKHVAGFELPRTGNNRLGDQRNSGFAI
jgi:hypothetical protein